MDVVCRHGNESTDGRGELWVSCGTLFKSIWKFPSQVEEFVIWRVEQVGHPTYGRLTGRLGTTILDLRQVCEIYAQLVRQMSLT
jgi:hypothetical protein